VKLSWKKTSQTNVLSSDKSKKKDSLVGSNIIAPEKNPSVESQPNLQTVQSNSPSEIQQESKSLLPNPSATIQLQQTVVRSNTPRQRIQRPINTPENKPIIESQPSTNIVKSNRQQQMFKAQQIKQESKSLLPNPLATIQLQQPVVRSNTPRQRIQRPINTPENKPIIESHPSTNIVKSNRPQEMFKAQQIKQESKSLLPNPSARQHLQQPVVRSNTPRQPIQEPISRLENRLSVESQQNSKLQIVQSNGSQQIFEAQQINQSILPRVKSKDVTSSNGNFLTPENTESLWSMFFINNILILQ